MTTTPPDAQDKKAMENEQCVAARDTTFDNIIPEKIWASVRTTPDRKYIQFIIEVNGIEKVIDQAYVGSYDGIISSSTQLTWILLKQKEAYEAMREERDKHFKDAFAFSAGLTQKDEEIEVIKDKLARAEEIIDSHQDTELDSEMRKLENAELKGQLWESRQFEESYKKLVENVSNHRNELSEENIALRTRIEKLRDALVYFAANQALNREHNEVARKAFAADDALEKKGTNHEPKD